METSFITLLFEILGKIAKSRDGKYLALLILLTAFAAKKEYAHAQEKDNLLIENNKKMEALLITCEKTVEKDRGVIDNQRWEINDLKMQIAVLNLR